MIIGFLILIYSVILHEIAHGLAADKLGDPTAKISGRLTLDPRPHIDPLMTILLPLMLVILGSPVVFGAAKPVPIDPFNFREPKKDMALASLAGPAVNILLAIILGMLFRSLIGLSFTRGILAEGLIFGVQMNLFLAFFNLLPIPPLDGSKVLAGILPDEYAKELLALERYGFLILFGVLFLFPGLVAGFVAPFATFFLKLILGAPFV